MENVHLFDIDPDPSFWAGVSIPVAGGEPVEVKMQFAYFDRDQYLDFWKEMEGKLDHEVLPQIVTDWRGFREPYSLSAMVRLLKKRPRAGRAILDAWKDELFGAPEKN